MPLVISLRCASLSLTTEHCQQAAPLRALNTGYCNSFVSWYVKWKTLISEHTDAYYFAMCLRILFLAFLYSASHFIISAWFTHSCLSLPTPTAGTPHWNSLAGQTCALYVNVIIYHMRYQSDMIYWEENTLKSCRNGCQYATILLLIHAFLKKLDKSAAAGCRYFHAPW